MGKYILLAVLLSGCSSNLGLSKSDHWLDQRYCNEARAELRIINNCIALDSCAISTPDLALKQYYEKQEKDSC